jgi:large subunit ribosomal protein L20
MPRATNAPARNRRRKKVLKRAKGFFGGQSKSFRVAAPKVKRAMAYAYVGRKVKKRDYRALWNVRINVAARENGLSYSKLIHGLHKAGVALDRKVLADIALHDPDGFARIAEVAKS